jgi:hypothetical protein
MSKVERIAERLREHFSHCENCWAGMFTGTHLCDQAMDIARDLFDFKEVPLEKETK